MSNAKLLAVSVERFKSFEHNTRVEFAPLTIILGRNNSGKSTLIQSLLLLKQTLRDVNPEVRLRLDGTVDAFNLRDPQYGLFAHLQHVIEVGRVGIVGGNPGGENSQCRECGDE